MWQSALVLLAGLVVGVGAYAAWASCDCGKLPAQAELARVIAGLSLVLVGAIALTQAGRGRVGLLMSGIGLVWFVDVTCWC